MIRLVAESEGFEPPDLLQSTVFKTAAFDHSANSPDKSFCKNCKLWLGQAGLPERWIIAKGRHSANGKVTRSFVFLTDN